ncbi:glycosyltransferase [Mangrovivirga cuniculi]|uniref:Glycosyltransferase family 1 protein n=1 Tax=Mangrovivirga cuniculi TaxID=2715131 RepID=A0A4D7JKE6_9BACT|nr:glycosyltransferase [Mangrovivirga cuniculi]QCK16071.1 glycosyltransferase family 1 protein [Mangrovivirga cuniculi]
MQKADIIFFNSTKSWGGGEKWHLETSTFLHNKGYKVLLIAHPEGELIQKASENSVPVEPFAISNLTFLNPFKVSKLSSLIKEISPQIIVMNMSSDLKAAGLAAKKAGVREIIYRRGSAIPIKNKALNRYLFGNVLTHILANSEETKRTLLANNPDLFDPEKIDVIYNGINLDKYLDNPVEEQKSPDFVIGNLGRVVPQKAQHYFIELAAILKEKGITDFKIKIGGDGPLLQELKDKAKEKNVSDHLEFTGFVENVYSFMMSIDVFVLTSLWEGFGYVLVEAMACEKPVVCFDITSNPEIIKDKETGYLVPFGDIDLLAQYIITLKSDDELREKMGKKGLERVKNKFTTLQSMQNAEEYFKRFLLS